MTAKRVDEETLRHLWNSGWTRVDIAKTMGVSEWTISAWANRLGLKPKGTGRRIINLDEAKLRQLWASDFTIEVIAHKMGMSSNNVHYHAKRLKFPPRSRGRVAMAPEDILPPPKPKAEPIITGEGLTGQLLATKGKWSLLAQVAKRHGLTALQAQQRYHRVRSMG